jgi:guanylate kinase
MDGSRHSPGKGPKRPRSRFEPIVFVVSAPSGAGKSTLVDALIESTPRLRRVVTCTTRRPRADEADGVSYHFLGRDEFDGRLAQGDFIEWNEIYGDCYGTSRRVFEAALDEARRRGEDLVLVIDVDGKEHFTALYGEAVTIFVMPPSIAELRSRIAERGTEQPEAAARRLARAEAELARAGGYGHRVVNDSKERAVNELRQIVAAERARRTAALGIDNSSGS